MQRAVQSMPGASLFVVGMPHAENMPDTKVKQNIRRSADFWKEQRRLLLLSLSTLFTQLVPVRAFVCCSDQGAVILFMTDQTTDCCSHRIIHCVYLSLMV